MALKIADKEFTSRLFTGTGKFASNQLMEDAILASESQLVTVALKRVNMDGKDDDILAHLKAPHITLLPNTSGVRTVKEAVFAAQLAREALGTNWLKLEIGQGAGSQGHWKCRQTRTDGGGLPGGFHRVSCKPLSAGLKMT